jgi:hypothetical protein
MTTAPLHKCVCPPWTCSYEGDLWTCEECATTYRFVTDEESEDEWEIGYWEEI